MFLMINLEFSQQRIDFLIKQFDQFIFFFFVNIIGVIDWLLSVAIYVSTRLIALGRIEKLNEAFW